MENASNQTDISATKKSLEDQVIKYDMNRMLTEAQEEFDAAISSRDLIDQESIGKFFNLKGDDNARN